MCRVDVLTVLMPVCVACRNLTTQHTQHEEGEDESTKAAAPHLAVPLWRFADLFCTLSLSAIPGLLCLVTAPHTSHPLRAVHSAFNSSGKLLLSWV